MIKKMMLTTSSQTCKILKFHKWTSNYEQGIKPTKQHVYLMYDIQNRHTHTKIATILMLAAVLSSCNREPEHRVWYGNNGMKVESKATNDKQYGKWKYIVRDNFGQILIRSNEEWNVGDTLWLSTHSH